MIHSPANIPLPTSADEAARKAFAERRRIEFDRCLHSFADQFREWKERTETTTWATHYSQVRAIETLLVGVCDKVKKEAEAAKSESDFPEILPEFEKAILSGWRVWEFFRGKLAQRQEEHFQAGLRAADELAWACRMSLAEAALEAGNLSPKEPALVFLNGNASPVALARGLEFWAESAPGLGQVDKYCKTLLEHVPVPLISLPWHEVWHAPGITAVAHEAGHVVEKDFKLEPDLDAVLKAVVSEAGVQNEQEAEWLKWRAEVFADFFAVRNCGPGYVGMLADVLVGTESDETKYPPTDLRMELCFAGLEQMDLPDEADSRRQAWRQLTKTNLPTSKAELATKVVIGLAKTPLKTFGNKPIGELVVFDQERLKHSLRIASSLGEGWRPDQPTDPQLLATAARLLYEQKPRTFEDDGGSLDVFELIAAIGAGQRRGLMRRSSVASGPTSEQMKGAIERAANVLLSNIRERRKSNGAARREASGQRPKQE